ncbi:MAG: oligosaccharide flippase family protein [Candidatus Thorarchaeota archaeon]
MRYLTDSIIVSIGTFMSTALLLLVQYLVGRVLGPNDFAVLSLAISIAYILSDVSDFGLKSTLVRYMSETSRRYPARSDDCLRTFMVLKFRLTVISSVIAALLVPVIAVLVFAQSPVELALLFSAVGITAGISMSVAWFIRSVFQAQKQFRAYALYSVVGNLAFLCLSVVVLSLFISSVLMMLSLAFSYLAWMGLGLARVAGRNRGSYDVAYQRQIFDFTKWIAASSVTVTLVNRADMLIVAFLLSYVDVANYSSAILVAQVVPLLTTSFSTVLFPSASEISDLGELGRFVRGSTRMTTGISVLMLVPLFLISRPVSLLFGSEYAAADVIFPIIFVGYLLGLASSPLSLAPLAVDRPDMLTHLNLIQLIITIVALPYLIMTWGLVGASLNILLIRLVTPAYLAVVTAKVLNGSIAKRQSNSFREQ